MKGPLAAVVLAAVPSAPVPAAATPEGQTAGGASDRTREALVRIASLEDMRSFGDGWLAARVYDPSHEVRRQAALALGRIGRPPAVAPLVDALAHDGAGAVRAAAAFALGILEDPLPEEAIAALTAALADPSTLVQEKAIGALGHQGPAAADLVSRRLEEILAGARGFPDWRENVEASQRRSSYDGVRLTLYALADTGARTPEASRPLLSPEASRLLSPEASRPLPSPDAARLLQTPDGSPVTGWWAAAWTAARLARTDLLPLYRAHAASPDPVVRLMGLRGITGIAAEAGPDAPELAAALADQWVNPDAAVRVEAIRAVSRLAEAGHPVPEGAGPALARALQDEIPVVRRAALAALAWVPHPAAASDLLDLLQAPAAATRAGALRALYRQDRAGFFLLLSGWSDREPAGRVQAAHALAGIPDDRIREFLMRSLLPDADAGVRTAAAAALAHHAAASPAGSGSLAAMTAALTARLDAVSVTERAAAADALASLAARLDDSGWAEAAFQLRRSAAGDTGPDPAFRLAALRALVRHGPESDRLEAARTALADPSWPVRREAHAFLRRRGESPEEPAPATALDPADYERMLHPPFTPVAWIETDRGTIEVELFIADAPRTVWRFMEQARAGAWNGVRFTGVTANRAVETGPAAALPGDHDPTVRSEANERLFMRGSLGLGDDRKDAAGSAFFISLLPQPQWNGRRTLFGHVRTGFRILDQIEPGDRIRRVRVWDGVTPPD